MNIVRNVAGNGLSWHGIGLGCATIFVILFASFVSAVSTHSLNLFGEAAGAVGVATFAYLTAICAIRSQQSQSTGRVEAETVNA